MRKWAVGIAIALLVVLAAMPVLAWGTATHAVIGIGVAKANGWNIPNRYILLQAVYGAAAADFALTAPQPLKSALFAATHDGPGYLAVPAAANPLSAVDRAFAAGWLTHNQVWGADFFAHLENPLDNPPTPPGYVEDRAAVLAASQGITQDAAHDYIEAAIDLLLDQEVPSLRLGMLVRSAAYYRDWRIPRLLVEAYGGAPGATPLRIRSLELVLS
jgi:hypothetical protein